MRKSSMITITAALCFSLFFIFSCSKSGGQESAAVAETPRSGTKTAKVTFIELGSVNCVPCKMMQPVMRKMEETFPNDVEVVFYDVWTEEQKHYAGMYGIRAIPTQVFLDENGEEYFRHEGFFPYEDVVEILKMKGVKG